MSNNAETNTEQVRPNFLARPPVNASIFFALLPFMTTSQRPVRSVRLPVLRLSAAGEGGSTDTTSDPQAVFSLLYTF
ncbi:hypothetical protein, partial [Antarctobacter heliothermus]